MLNLSSQVFYQETGLSSAPALILLHSGGMNHSEWQPQLPLLEKFYRVICLDLPGHGSSIMQGSHLSISECGSAILTLMAQLEIKQALFCGSSLGGACVLWLARFHPEKIAKMVLYRVNYKKNSGTFAQTRLMADPKYWEEFGLAKHLAKLHEPQGDLESWKIVIQRVSEALDPISSEHNHTLADLKNMQMPCLIACGDRDPLVPLADVFDMHQVLPNSDLWIMPHASHVTATNTWRALSFANEIHRFFGKSNL